MGALSYVGTMLLWAALVAVVTDPGSVHVSITPRGDCPSAAEVEEDVQELLGADEGIDGEASIQIFDRGDEVVGVVRLQGAQSMQTRTLQGGSCAGVADAAALVIAVGLDPMGVRETLEPLLSPPRPPPVPEPSVPAPQLPPVVDEPEVSSPPSTQPDVEPSRGPVRARRPWSVHGWILGGPTLGLLPGPSGRLGGGLAASTGQARIELSTHYEFARNIDHSDSPDSGASMSMTSIQPAACWTPRVRSFTFPVCGGVVLGWVTGRGRGLQQERVARSLFVAAAPSVRGLWQATRWFAFGLDLEVPVPIRRPRFQIDDFSDPLVQLGGVGLFAGVVVEFTFFDKSASSRR